MTSQDSSLDGPTLRELYPRVLASLEELLRQGGGDDWVRLVHEARAAWDAKKDLQAFLGLFGGMGSLNDWIPGPVSGSAKGVAYGVNRGPWYSAAFEQVLSCSYAIADAIRRNESLRPEVALRRPYQSWHLRLQVCPQCRHVMLPSEESSNLVASRVTWEVAVLNLSQGRPEAVAEFDSTSMRPEAQALRDSIRRLAKKEGWASDRPRTRLSAQGSRADPAWPVMLPLLDVCPLCSEEGVRTEEVRVEGPADALSVTSRSAVLNADLSTIDVPPHVLHAFQGGPEAGRAAEKAALKAKDASIDPEERK